MRGKLVIAVDGEGFMRAFRSFAQTVLGIPLENIAQAMQSSWLIKLHKTFGLKKKISE